MKFQSPGDSTVQTAQTTLSGLKIQFPREKNPNFRAASAIKVPG